MSKPERFSEGEKLGLPQKTVKIHQALESENIPHAFGGAISTFFHREPRATHDIDIDIFLPPDQYQRVLKCLGKLFPIENPEVFSEEVLEREQGELFWEQSRIDLFFTFDEFHKSVAERVEKGVLEDVEIPILSAEDIIIFKILYDRGKDWWDIEEICEFKKGELDLPYMTHWLSKWGGPDDERLKRLTDLVEKHRTAYRKRQGRNGTMDS